MVQRDGADHRTKDVDGRPLTPCRLASPVCDSEGEKRVVGVHCGTHAAEFWLEVGGDRKWRLTRGLESRPLLAARSALVNVGLDCTGGLRQMLLAA